MRLAATIVLITLAVLVGLYFVYILLNAYLGVKSAPRTPMMLCEKHGPIMENGTIDFFGTKYCGLCFNDKMNAAERGEIR